MESLAMASRLFITVVFDDADHRAENFFLGDAHLVLHVGKDGGGVVEAALDAFALRRVCRR